MHAPLRALLGWLVLAGAFAITVSAAGAQTDEREDLPQLSVAERDRAATIYASDCATCHGASGQGGVIPGSGERAPALVGRDDVTVPYLDLVLRTGRMPPPGDPFDNRARNRRYTGAERELLVAYLTDAFDLEGEIPDPPAGDAGRGRDLYATNCAACHGPLGEGGVAGAGAWTPQVNGYGPVLLAEAIRVGPFQMPAFDEDQIDDQGIGDIAAFMEYIQEEPATPLGIRELNPVYLAAFAAALALVMLLSLMWISGTPTWFPDPAADTGTSGSGDPPEPVADAAPSPGATPPPPPPPGAGPGRKEQT